MTLPTAEQWRTFLDQPKMQRRAVSKHRMRNVFPALFEMYVEQHPRARKPRVVVMDTLMDIWRSGMTYLEWAALARQRLGLRCADEEPVVVPLFETKAREGEGDE